MTTPTDDYVHLALVGERPPRSQCDGPFGPDDALTMRIADVTCPACLQLDADRKARAEVHDTHAIPATDEHVPTGDQKYLPGDWVDLTLRNARVFGVGATDEHSVLMVGHDTMPEVVSIALTDDVIVTVLVRTRAEAPGPSELDIEPAKTYDLSVRREFGNVIVRAEAGLGSRVVYLQDGVALDLGHALAVLTPAQIALLVDDLTGGEK